MKPFLLTVASKLTERTTWLGLATMATALGIYLSPEDVALITSIGTAIAGAVLVKMRDPV